MYRAAFFASQKMLLNFARHKQPDGCRSCREAPLRAERSATHSAAGDKFKNLLKYLKIIQNRGKYISYSIYKLDDVIQV